MSDIDKLVDLRSTTESNELHVRGQGGAHHCAALAGDPNPFPAATPCPVQAFGLSSEEQNYLATTWLPRLNAAVRAAANAQDVTYLDATILFTGHKICTTLPYVSGLKPLYRESFHPTPAGYTAITEAVVPLLQNAGLIAQDA